MVPVGIALLIPIGNGFVKHHEQKKIQIRIQIYILARPGGTTWRVFACAQDLFHRRGIRGVGVEEAIAEAAGTSKMALYRHFDSKDELIH